MSLKIRLTRIGKKNAPSFRVVVSQTRTKRNGKFLDIIGDYNPVMGGKPVIDKEKVKEWVSKGALITPAVEKMLEGKYKYVKYSPRGEKQEAKEETPATEEK